MTGSILWGVAADSLGHTHWSGVESETTPDGRLIAWRVDQWAEDPASVYARQHRAPLSLKWQHVDDVGRVIALRRMHGKLFAVAECDLSADDLRLLTEAEGPLRFSTTTGHLAGERALRLTEISLTARPASVGLPEVRWVAADAPRSELPGWVREDLTRGNKYPVRSASVIEVFEPDVAERAQLVDSDDRYRHDPREVFHSGAVGRVLAVNGRPVRRY